MNKALIEKLEDGTIKITITLPKEDVEKTRLEVVDEYVKTANLPGFRQGKAPAAMVEEKIDKEKLKEDILKKLLPVAYTHAVQENKIRPIMNPKIHINKLENGQDWEFTALTCEEPELDLGEYKKNIIDLTAKSKIIVPGKEEKKASNEELMKVIIDSVKAKIPAILIEQEADKLLSQLLNDIKKLGLNLDQYLASTNRNPEALRTEYSKRAEDDIKLEFALHKIAEAENITVDPKEVDEAIQKAHDDEERARLEANRYLLSAILRQQKTIDFLLNL